ncbi:MAG: hypothetical protein HY652_03705 [Acidobacteria bacterium]|nr:hypothetical protein [Acidobacteriota bacterium]
MVTKEQVLGILKADFPGEVASRLESAASRIVALFEAWEEIPLVDEEMGYSLKVDCTDICKLAQMLEEGAVVKVFRKKGERQPGGNVYSKFLLQR